MMNHYRIVSIAATIGFVVSLIVFLVTFHDYSALYAKFRKDRCPITEATWPEATNDTRGWIDCGPYRVGACVRVYTSVAPGVMINRRFPIPLQCTLVGDCHESRETQMAWAARVARSFANTTQTCYHDPPPVTAVYLDKPRFSRMGGLVTMYVLLFVFGIIILFLCMAASGGAKMHRAPYMAEAAESPLLPVNDVAT